MDPLLCDGSGAVERIRNPYMGSLDNINTPQRPAEEGGVEIENNERSARVRLEVYVSKQGNGIA